jgi:hypothetical protein
VFTFGNTCPSCIAIGPEVEQNIHQAFKDNPDFVIVGLDTWDTSSSTASVTGFKNSTGITFPLAIKASSVAALYQTTYDRLLVIDKNGILRHKGGVVVSNDLNNALEIIQTRLEEEIADPCESAGLVISGTVTDPTCFGESNGMIDVAVTGNHPDFTYGWSTNIPGEDQTDLAAGTYSLTVTDSAGCTASAEFMVENPDAIVLGTITGETNVSSMGTFMYSVDAGEGLDIFWTVEGGSLVAGQGSSTAEVQWAGESTGSIAATATSPEGCSSNEVSLTVTIAGSSTGLEDRVNDASLLYPNPVTDLLNIHTQEDVLVSVYDMSGKLRIKTQDTQVDVTSLKSGIYTVWIMGTSGGRMQKIMKK